MHTTFFRRVVGVAVGAVMATALAASPAVAAPTNDQIANARVITSIPMRATVDTRPATTNVTTDVGGYPCMGTNSVWYRFRPTAAVTARVVTLGSNFDTMLGVFRGQANNLTPVACSDDTSVGSAVEVRFFANTTYFIAVSSCCSVDGDLGGGDAVLRMYIPQALTANAIVTGGEAGDISGRAFLQGTYRCSNLGFMVIQVVVSQRVGSQVARGSGGFGSACERSRQPFTIAVDAETGVAFRPGLAALTITTEPVDGFGSDLVTRTELVTLEFAPRKLAATPSMAMPVVK